MLKESIKYGIAGFVFFVCGTGLSFGQTEFNSGDYGVLRIENEYKLTVPTELSDSVWEYLKSKYDNNDLYLKSIDSSFSCKTSEDLFIDQYFDDPAHQLWKNQNGIRYRTRFVLSDSSNGKNGKELVQIKINNISSNELNRGEFKYPVKHYEDKDEEHDNHPFLGLVKRKHRADVISRLKQNQIEALELFPTIKLEQIRRRIYISKDSADFATLTLDNVTALFQGKSAVFIEMEMELNEIEYTEGDSLSRNEMEKINELIKSDLLSRFPQIAQDQTPKYNKAVLALDINMEEVMTEVESSDNGVSLLYYAGFGIMALLVVIVVVKKVGN